MKLKKILVPFIILSFILVTSGSFLLKPKPVQAAWPGESETSEFAYKPLKGTVWSMFKMVFFQMINWGRIFILTGKSDIPIIPSNLSEYAEDTAIEKVKQSIDNAIGLDKADPETGKLLKESLRSAFTPIYKRSAIPLSTAKESWENINKGAATFEDFVKIAQPQNNFFGAYLLASSNLEEQKNTTKSDIIQEFLTNQGFLTPKKKEQVASEKSEDKPGATETKETLSEFPQEVEDVLTTVASSQSSTSELKQLADSKTWDTGLVHIPGALLEALANVLGEKAFTMLTQQIYKIQNK